MVQKHQSGVVLDFELIEPATQPDFAKFIHDLAAAMHGANLKLMVALPAADWSYDYKYIASQADAVILMNYDLHYPTSDPGHRVAGLVQRNIENILKIVPADKIVMGIANYGYDWPAKTKAVPHPVAAGVIFQQAHHHGGRVAVGRHLRSRDAEPALLLRRRTKSGSHRVDARRSDGLQPVARGGTAGRAWHSAVALGHGRPVDLVNLGCDTSRRRHPREDRGNSPRLRPDHRRAGDIWRITATPQIGRRTFDYDAVSDVFDDESYQSYPLSWRIQAMGLSPHKLALTFDDGPDPTYTPQILKILKEKNVPAAFFVIGESANQYSSLVRREYNEGNEVGNHTFTHPDFETISKSQLQIELNLTELLLESNLGVKTTAVSPAVRHRSPARNGERNSDASDPAGDGLHHRRRANRSARLGRGR